MNKMVFPQWGNFHLINSKVVEKDIGFSNCIKSLELCNPYSPNSIQP